MYMRYVCFYVCCSDCVGVCDNVCCVAAIVENSHFLCLGVLKYVVCLCGDVMDVVFSVCIVRCGALGARAGCASSSRSLPCGNWKCRWAIGRPFNGHPPCEWK